MHNPPTSDYSGLTLILDHPSRFDTDHLLTGIAGSFVEDECINPLKLSNIDVRDNRELMRPFLPGTKYVAWMGNQIPNPTGQVPPGYIITASGIRHVQIWHPQDCVDPRQYELSEDADADDEAISDFDTKNSYPTRRTNYKFWTAWIIKKLINPTPPSYDKIQISSFPPIQAAINALNQAHGCDLYLDIETSIAHRSIQCIGFSTTHSFPKVFVIPIYNWQGNLVYPRRELFRFHAALSKALQYNTVVIHNTSFDLLILHAWYKYHLPLLDPYDTMHAGHRCFPEAEKSLSHNIVAWTELPYHKISSVECFNPTQQRVMWDYNAKDVYALKYIKDAQLAYAASIPGLSDSIAQVNSMIIPYLDMTFLGLPIDRAAQLDTEQSLLKQRAQYERITRILVDNPCFNPGSSKQCAAYLHKDLQYPVVSRTETGAPKLGKKQFYQLLLKHKNPALNAILAYKKAAKDLSMLAFNFWKMP